MVEVVTLEEFIELRKSVDERLGSIERKLDELAKEINENQVNAKTTVDELLRSLNERLDDLEESSKSFVDRLRDAIRPRTPEPSRTGFRSIGNTERTLGRVSDVVRKCQNFFDWDWCQDNCPMYLLCDEIASIQDISKLSKKESTERFKRILKHLEALRSRPRDESPDIVV
jgi:hypothetical protein